tara:strand:- start:242 stop:466 length:225 start_codon:yes stop_codon:yes gene_type:complete
MRTDNQTVEGTKASPIPIANAEEADQHRGLWCKHPSPIGDILIKIEANVVGHGYDLSEEEVRWDTTEQTDNQLN